MRISDTNVRVDGNEDNYVAVDKRGTTISGPVSFVAMPDQIRFAGLWTMNNVLRLSIPSTMATPSAVMTVDLPMRQLGSLMAEAGIMMGLCGMLTGV